MFMRSVVPDTAQVEVTTGSMRGAGTDARVGIVLYGKHGDTGERFLDKSLTNRSVPELWVGG
jgi:hypothetical protein